MNKKYVISAGDIAPKIEYIGLWNLLDELIKKVKETNDTTKIELYCELYAKLYKLLKLKESGNNE